VWLDSAEDVPTISGITRMGVSDYIFMVIFSLGSVLSGMRRGVQSLGISVPAIPFASSEALNTGSLFLATV